MAVPLHSHWDSYNQLVFDCSSASLIAQLVKNLPAMRETWVWSLDWENHLEKGTATHCSVLAWRIPWTVVCRVAVGHDWNFHWSYIAVAQTVKNLHAMQTRVRSLGWKVPLEKRMAIHSSILAWRIPWTKQPGKLQSVGSQGRTRLSS